MHDLGPAAKQLASLIANVTDDQLTAPTPCPAYTLGDLVDHVNGLSLAFVRAATKNFPPGPSTGPSGDAARLGGDWRTRIPRQLDTLAEAWRATDAWEGMTQAGGVDLPGHIAGGVALNELVIHGWDIAQASGQPHDLDPATLAASLPLVEMFASPEPSEGPYGPSIDVPDNAPVLDRIVGLSGRDPAWAPPG